MFKTLFNVFRIPELRNKVLFTLLMLAIYRIGYHVPLLGVDQVEMLEKVSPGTKAVIEAEDHLSDAKSSGSPTAIENAKAELAAAQAKKAESAGQTDNSASGRLASYVSLFSGGSLQQSTIFGLGVMPYISASIIFQLLTTVLPSLEKLQKEGETGRKKIQEWTRYATVPLAAVQGIFWISWMRGSGIVESTFANTAMFWFSNLLTLTAGCVFLMWLGEQIDEYGLGNGISLIILSGIVARMPSAIGQLIAGYSTQGDQSHPITPGKIIFLIASFVFIVAGSILITQAQRRIPVQQAKHTRGRRVYGGSKQYLPLRVNHGGVMPIIFASSLMLFPQILFSRVKGMMDNAMGAEHANWFYKTISFLNDEFGRGAFLYLLLEVIMIYFFAYFWTTVQFQPKEMANQLRDYGSFIPGLRPGKRTSDYLEKVMMRITYVGAAFLCIIAVVPSAISAWLGIPPLIAQFLGGTGLLIVVSVALDMVQRIEANLLMRNYGGFLSGPGQKGKRIKGRQY